MKSFSHTKLRRRKPHRSPSRGLDLIFFGQLLRLQLTKLPLGWDRSQLHWISTPSVNGVNNILSFLVFLSHELFERLHHHIVVLAGQLAMPRGLAADVGNDNFFRERQQLLVLIADIDDVGWVSRSRSINTDHIRNVRCQERSFCVWRSKMLHTRFSTRKTPYSSSYRRPPPSYVHTHEFASDTHVFPSFGCRPLSDRTAHVPAKGCTSIYK